MDEYSKLEAQYAANNYAPLPVVLNRGEGIYVWDIHENRYIDMMSAYSAVNFGHCNTRLVHALTKQANQLNIVSRDYHTDKLGPFLERACTMFKQECALPMNTGAEAVETALKIARKWAYKIKGVDENQAEIIVAENNFHGRTITIISMSTEPQYRDGFAPFTGGFKVIPYGDANALEKAITPNTAAFLVEPIQAEGGIILPPTGYLAQCAKICKKKNVLFIADEVQTGLGRTGKLLACDHEKIQPDGLILGKALGGGILPVSLFLTRRDVMEVLQPGDHGSTFGGNPLAAVIGLESLKLLEQNSLAERAAKLGDYFISELRKISSPLIKDIRGKGLFIGIEVNTDLINARELCLKLLKRGLLTKDTNHKVIRLVPPLVISKEQLDDALEIIKHVFTS